MGCYAENGPFPLFYHADRGDETCDRLIDTLRSLRSGMVRLNVAGDYLDEDSEPDMAYIEATNEARHLDVISYTHAWRRMDPAWFHPKTRPNASCESIEQVREAVASGWRAVLTDDGTYIGSSGMVVCLYDTKGMQCIDCGLCAKDRKSTVIFPVHGTRKRKAAQALMEVRDASERLAGDAEAVQFLP